MSEKGSRHDDPIPASDDGSEESRTSEQIREEARILLLRKRAADNLGFEESQAENLYMGGLSADAFDEKRAAVPEKRIRIQERLRVAATLQKKAEVRVKPKNIEFIVHLKHIYEPLGCVFADDSMLISQVHAGGAACRAGIVPIGTVHTIDEVRVRSPTALVETIRTLRLAKRLEYIVEVHYETPPMDLLGASCKYTAQSIAAMPRMTPQWRYRDQHSAYQTKEEKPAGEAASQLLELITANANKSVDKRKRLVRVPEGLKEADLEDISEVDAQIWRLMREEGERREELLRWVRGRLVALKAVAPEDIAFVVDRAYIDAMGEDLTDDSGWVWRKVWEHSVSPWMVSGSAVERSAPPHIPPQHKKGTFILDPTIVDWVNPRERPPGHHAQPSSVLKNRSAGPPNWAVEAARTAIVFALGGVGKGADYVALRERTDPATQGGRGPVLTHVKSRSRQGVKTPPPDARRRQW